MTQHNIVYVCVADCAKHRLFLLNLFQWVWNLIEFKALQGNDCPSPLYSPFALFGLLCDATQSITAELLTAAMTLSADTVAGAATPYLLLLVYPARPSALPLSRTLCL